MRRTGTTLPRHQPKPGRELSDRETVVPVVTIASLPVLSGTMLVVAVPDVAEALQTSPGSAVSVVTAYLVVLALTQPLAGAVADRVGLSRAVRAGLGVVAIGSLLALLSWSLAGLLVARIIQALGFSLVVPGIHAQLIRGPGGEARRFGLLTAAGSLVAASGPLLGGLLVAHTGWRGIFAVTGVLAAASALIVPSAADMESSAAKRDRGVPVLEILVDNRVLAAAGLNCLDNLVLYSLLVGVPFLLVDAGPLPAATALAILTLACAAAAPVGGRIADRTGHVVPVRLGFSVAGVGLIALLCMGPSPGHWAAAAAVAVTGAGLGLEFPSLQAAPLRLVPAGSRATTAGLMASARQFGSVCGAAAVAGLVAFGPTAVFGIGALAAILAPPLARSLNRTVTSPGPARLSLPGGAIRRRRGRLRRSAGWALVPASAMTLPRNGFRNRHGYRRVPRAISW